MDYKQELAADGIVIALRDSFTFQDHHAFRAVLDALKAAGTGRKVLDLSQVTFLDSAALGMLLVAAEEVGRQKGGVTLRNPSSQISRLFELAALDTLFTIEQTGSAPADRAEVTPARRREAAVG